MFQPISKNNEFVGFHINVLVFSPLLYNLQFGLFVNTVYKSLFRHMGFGSSLSQSCMCSGKQPNASLYLCFSNCIGENITTKWNSNNALGHWALCCWWLSETKGVGEVEEGTGKIDGNGRRLDLGLWTHSTVYRWYIMELYTWNLCDFIIQCHPNTFNKFFFKDSIWSWLVWLSGLSTGLQTKGRWFDSQSGNTPGLQARSPGFSHMLMFLS